MNIPIDELIACTDKEFVKYILSINNNGIKFLNQACENCNIQQINLLLDNGVDVNGLDDTDFPLRQAVISGKVNAIEVINLLLDRGANINLQNNFKWTALIKAARNSNGCSSVAIVKLLLDKGADINLQNIEGYTALSASINFYKSESNIETIKLLLDYGAEFTDKIYNSSSSDVKKILDSYRNRLYFGVKSNEKKEIKYPGIIIRQNKEIYYYVSLLNKEDNEYSFDWDKMIPIFRSLECGEPKIYQL